jgi:hypothetical protein
VLWQNKDKWENLMIDYEAEYTNALAEYRIVSESFRKVQADYRARRISDAEFLAVRRNLDNAGRKVDELEYKLSK